jgi:hypothetical protein
MALENTQGGSAAISNADAASAQPTAVDVQTPKQSGIDDGLGKLFYLRS